MIPTRPIQIKSQVNGHTCDAQLILCPDCAGELFLVYFPSDAPTYPHLQCARCSTSICQGCPVHQSYGGRGGSDSR